MYYEIPSMLISSVKKISDRCNDNICRYFIVLIKCLKQKYLPSISISESSGTVSIFGVVLVSGGRTGQPDLPFAKKVTS